MERRWRQQWDLPDKNHGGWADSVPENFVDQIGNRLVVIMGYHSHGQVKRSREGLMLKMILTLFVFIAGAWALDIPITVKEALPANVTAGWARSGEPVKLGVPLLDAENISSTTQLGIQGVTDVQFRVMARYATGNIRWVLVDFPASVSAKDSAIYHLVDNGSGQAAESLAVDEGMQIVVNTGAMQVKIKKTQTNIFDEVSVGGVTYISSGNNGGLWLQQGGEDYRSNYDADSCRVVIEENGPFRCCIRIDGFLFKSDHSDFCMRYGMRLHFYKNKRYTRAFLTLKNDIGRHTTFYEIKGLHWELKTTLNSAPAYQLSGTGGDITGAVDQQVTLVQGYSDFRAVYLYGFSVGGYKDRWIPNDGYAVYKGGNAQHAFGDASAYALGYADIRDGAKKVSLAYRQLSANGSGGFELNPDGNCAITVMTMHKDSTYKFAFYCHETRELLVSFGGTDSGKSIESCLNYPLFGMVPFDRYRATGTYFNETRLASYEEQLYFYNNYTSITNFSIPNPSETEEGDWDSGIPRIGPFKIAASAGGGPDGNMCHADAALLRTLQTGLGGYFLYTHNWINGICDAPLQHAYDFKLSDLSGNLNETVRYAGGNTCNGIGIDYKTYVEGEHPHWLSIVPWYYITGDERIKENWRDAVNHRKHHRWMCGRDILSGAGVSEERYYTYDVRDVAVANYLFDDMPGTEKDFNVFVLRNAILPLASDSDFTKAGWDVHRGFWDGGNASGGPRSTASFFVLEKHAENMGLVKRILGQVLPDSIGLDHKLRDRLLGLAYYNEKEQYMGRNAGDYHVYNGYPIDSNMNSSKAMDFADDASYLQAYGYEQTGDTAFLNTGKHLFYLLANVNYCNTYLS
ncbi:MAG: hypothetical protein V1913_08255, partial [Fibrobacterota bacterium]